MNLFLPISIHFLCWIHWLHSLKNIHVHIMPYYLMILRVPVSDDPAKVDFSYRWAVASTRRLQHALYIRCAKWSSNRSAKEVRIGFIHYLLTAGIPLKFQKLCLVFRRTGLSGHKENRRWLWIRTGRPEAVVQHHPGHVLYGNGELVGGDQGSSGRIGQSNRILSSWDSYRYRDICDFRNLPTGY